MYNWVCNWSHFRAWPMGHAGQAPHVPPPPAECHINQTCGLEIETGPAEELASSLTKPTRRPLGRRGGRSVAPLDSGPHSPNKIPRARGEGREREKGRARTRERRRGARTSGEGGAPRPQPAVDIRLQLLLQGTSLVLPLLLLVVMARFILLSKLG